MSHPSEVSTQDLVHALQDGPATVVDVREPGEYVRGHVPGATLVPLAQLPARLAEVERSDRVYVVCASGNRSQVGADVLRAAGYDAVSVAGGTSGWQRGGHPVVAGQQPTG